MIKVVIFRADGNIAGFEAQGHAGAGETGYDIVCSAVSALTQTAIMGLVELLKLDCAYEIEDGRAYCMLSQSIDGAHKEKAEIILKTMVMGLESIAQNYKDNLRMIEREV